MATTAFAQALLDGPTELRGHDLLRHVMDIIVADSPAESNGGDTGGDDAHWMQRTWCQINQLPLDIVKTKHYDDYYVNDDHIDVVAPKDIATHCGTSACLAGHTVMLVGDLLQVDGPHYAPQLGNRVMTIDDNRDRYIAHRAAELLDINDRDARILFHAYNSLATLVEITDAIINGHDIMDCIACGKWCPMNEHAIPKDGPQVIMCAPCREYHAENNVNSFIH